MQATDPEWFVRRGTCRHELGEEPMAQADYEKAVQLDPGYAPGHYYLGLSCIEQKAIMRGLVELDKAAKTGRGTPIGKLAQDKHDEVDRRIHKK
jgi:hypothetical protein